MKLPMPEGEIVARYRSMAAGQDRLVILAELNNTSRSRIADVLARHGIPVDMPRRGSWGGARRFRELYDQGMSDSEIAWRCGVVPTTVGNWRRKAGLAKNI